jgi:hypothetical protein
MKGISTFFLTFLAFSCLCGQEKVRVALFETQGTAKESVRKELNEALMDALFNSPNTSVLDPAALSSSVKVSGVFDESLTMKAGKSAGAKYICVSSVNSDDGKEFAITYNVKDAATGEIIVRERKSLTAGELKSAFAQISKSQLLASNNDVGNTSQKPTAETHAPPDTKTTDFKEKETAAPSAASSPCGCEIAEADLPDDAEIPKGWRLPTLKELECMCQHKDEIGGFNFGVYLSSDKEQGLSKGIKFQFCNEVSVDGSYSRRLVRETGNTVQESDEVKTSKTSQRKQTATSKTTVKEEAEEDAAMPSAETSLCGCEVAEADLPEGVGIPKGWRLPTLAELECMCRNKDNIGGFHQGIYLSSNKEQGYSKGIKFQFCNDVTITGSYSIRVVRGGNSKRQSGTVKTAKSQGSAYNSESNVLPASNLNTESYDYGNYTLQEGFELGVDFGYCEKDYYDASYLGLTAAYRFAPKIAVGLGLGMAEYAFFDFNFTETKFSPFIRAELGFTNVRSDYYGGYSGDYYSSVFTFYAGAILGFRLSFNEHWALQAGVKAVALLEYEEVFFPGLNLGLVYHF